jgi:hypothetical protein
VANAFTSTELLASLKRRGLIPSSVSTFLAADFFKVVDDETQTYIVPLLAEVREEYLVTYKDITVVSGTTEYDIPERAVAGKIRDVTLSDGNGGYTSLARIEPENVTGAASSVTGAAISYYLRGNKIVLIGTGTTGTLRVTFYQRPNRVVATTAVGEITAINTGTKVVTISVPTTFTTGVTYDFVKGRAGFDTLGQDLVATAVGASTVTMDATLPTDLVVGDFLCLAQETPIAQIPVDLHPLLAQRVAATVLHALGDPKAENAYGVADKMEKRILKLLTPRTEGSSRYVINRYGVGR